MSTTAELETFVQKFHQLWNAGLSAHLDLDCHAGVKCVGLCLQLGHCPGPLHHQVYSPPPARCPPPHRKRRTAAHVKTGHAAEKASNPAETEVINMNEEDTEEVSTMETIRTAEMNKIEDQDYKEKESDNIVELEKTGEVLLENNDDEKIAGKAVDAENTNATKIDDENTNANKNEDENGREPEGVVELIHLEKEEGFIGPRLPKVLSDEEFRELMDKLLGDKYSKD